MRIPLLVSTGSVHAEIRIGEVIFEIDRFCIEKTAKQLHQHLKKKIIDSENPEPELINAIELLRIFLAQENFSKIRTSDETLSGGHKQWVKIFHDRSRKVQWSKV